MKLKRNFISSIVNTLGWHTSRKIIVFESDDWGMVRMPSKKSYNKLLKMGYPIDKCSYSTNDSLEGNLDAEGLLEILSKYKNSKRQSPIFTLNNVAANPDFDKIRKSNFKEYHREPFTETYKQYADSENVLNLWKEGIKNKIIYPQYHATEHLNLNRWMKTLKSQTNKIVKDAFDENMFSLYSGNPASCQKEYLDAFGLGHDEEYQTINSILGNGLDLFENTWGFRSMSFIAPCYIWPSSLEFILSKLGVRYIQGTRVQLNALNNSKKFKKKYHYTGQKNQKTLQRYLVRNVSFEPSENLNNDWVNKALSEIDIAFRFKKPAIISTHRVNYIGRLNTQNRDNGLKLLDELLKNILKKWPEVEFMSSNQLGDLISNNK